MWFLPLTVSQICKQCLLSLRFNKHCRWLSVGEDWKHHSHLWHKSSKQRSVVQRHHRNSRKLLLTPHVFPHRNWPHPQLMPLIKDILVTVCASLLQTPFWILSCWIKFKLAFLVLQFRMWICLLCAHPDFVLVPLENRLRWPASSLQTSSTSEQNSLALVERFEVLHKETECNLVVAKMS